MWGLRRKEIDLAGVGLVRWGGETNVIRDPTNAIFSPQKERGFDSGIFP